MANQETGLNLHGVHQLRAECRQLSPEVYREVRDATYAAIEAVLNLRDALDVGTVDTNPALQHERMLALQMTELVNALALPVVV